MDRLRGKRFCFTINNFTYEQEEKVRRLGEWYKWKDDIQCAIAEEEHLDNGTPHIQGYLHFSRQVTGSALKSYLGDTVHLEVARGSDQVNWNYCSKEDQVILKVGEPISARIAEEKDEKALTLIHDMQTMTRDQFMEQRPRQFLIHHKLQREVRHEFLSRNHISLDCNLKEKNFWICGAPGIGKSRLARKGIKAHKIYSKPFNKWWNGFDPDTHTRVIIDDWPDKSHGGDMLVPHLKIWADRYSFTGEIKCNSEHIVPSFQLIVTSNYDIESCFTNQVDIEAIKRRFTEFIMLNEDDNLDQFLVIDE